MAAYGSLVSLIHTLDQIQHHPRPPISLDKTQVESLTKIIESLLKSLDLYSQKFRYKKEADPLEMRIADAAYAAEDLIESHIVDPIHAPSTSKNIKGSPTDKLCKSLQKVIKDMESLDKKAAKKIEKERQVRDQLLRSTMTAVRSSTGQKTTMVGFDEELRDIVGELTGGQPDRQIISIVGMGGSGKTTLTRNIYQNKVVHECFVLRAWVTISQDCTTKECFLELLKQVLEEGQKLRHENEVELGGRLHKKLFGRKYLIIIDDIWDTGVWGTLSSFLPDNKNGSRIVITTRISNIEPTSSYVHEMGFLDEKNSRSLFSKIVFEEEGCPPELTEIGKKIVESCRGLPLSIVAVGGLLAKSENTREYWESVAGNLNSIVNSDNDERCLRILQMSYNQLPVKLKPCFLYMGVFPEDRKIRVSELIKLWVGEGLLKPIDGKTLEEVADEHLQDLINRNLVLAHEVGSIGKVKYCKIHDLLRDLCLRQAEKEGFYNVIQHFSRHVPLKERFYSVLWSRGRRVPPDTSALRRIVIPEKVEKSDVSHALQTMSPARSLIFNHYTIPEIMPSFRLLRMYFCPSSSLFKVNTQDDMLKFVNLQCVILKGHWQFPYFVLASKLWNLQTLIIERGLPAGLIDIWNMPQLRHLKIGDNLKIGDRFKLGYGFKLVDGFKLTDLPIGDELGNLQTLGPVSDFNCSEELANRIPNIKRLEVRYSLGTLEEPRNYCATFGRLKKLEALCLRQQYAREGHDIPQDLSFPNSLKKLTLHMDNTYWEDKLEKVGSLPLLQKFKLIGGFFRGGKWETVEGQFPSLKFLSVEACNNLKYWETESSHFPCLEHLVLRKLEQLEELHSEIGEISNLKAIELWSCSPSVHISAEEILEEQKYLFGEVVLQILIDGQRLVSKTRPDSESA